MHHHVRVRVLSACLTLVGLVALAPAAAALDIDLRDVEGTPSDDVLRGTRWDDRLWSGDGNNVLFGLGADDKLYAGPERDRLYGGRGADLLRGRPGRDLMVLGPGDDRGFAGRGRDVFTLGRDRSSDKLDCGTGRDLVRYAHGRDPRDRFAGCERIIRGAG